MSLEGQRLGEFEILERLGQGGMGAVYKARQVSLERFVALKTLQGALASDPEYIARFRREAKAAAALNHPNLVQVYAAGENDGLHWFAMEYVEGESAQARMKRKERLDPAAAIAIAIHTATALDYAWRKAQLIHRDIKPDNIFLSSDGEVKLGDLGLAKSAGEDQSLTTTGASMGTPHYVSPEQGEGKKDVDLRADIYSLGCTLFHFVAGETPFKGDTAMGVMLKHVTAPVPELITVWPQCPAELSRVVMKMMAKDPAERQQTYAEVIADLRRAYDAFTSATVPAMVSVTKHGGGAPRKRIAVVAFATGGILLFAALAMLLHFAPWKKGGQVIAPAAVSSKGWTNLIASADVKCDSLMAPWTLENGALRSPQRNVATDEDAPGSHQMFAFPVPNPPRNYDLRYRITRNQRGYAVIIPFVRDGDGGDLRIDGGNGFRLGPPNRGKEKQPRPWLPPGETHEVLIEVREDRVRISHDGKVQLDHAGKIPSGQLDSPFYPPAKLQHPIIGIGVCGGDITVHSAEFREVDKEGRPVTAAVSAPPAVVVATPTVTPPAPPAATPSPVVVKADPVKFDPAREAAYVGIWSGGKGNKAYIMKADHTALKTEEDGKRINGKWSVVNGEFQVNWDQGRSFSGRLTEDGQRIIGDGKVDWFRKKP